jgi:hypothetical protein
VGSPAPLLPQAIESMENRGVTPKRTSRRAPSRAASPITLPATAISTQDHGAMRFADLDEPVQRTARWIAERYAASDVWPTEAEFARFCFRADIPLDRLRSGHWHDVYDGSIGFTNATDNPSVRVKPWIFYDLGLCAEAFDAAFAAYLSAIDQLAAGPALVVTIDHSCLPANVPVPMRRLAGHVLIERHSGSQPDNEGRWSVIVQMYDLKRPVPDLDGFVKRPDVRTWATAGNKIQREPKATPWAFVSSTYVDLKKHRQATLDALLRQKVLPLGMELWTASPTTALRYCLDELALSDFMILIVGERYGSVTSDGLSFTETEYNQAKELQLPVYVFLPQKLSRRAPPALRRFAMRLGEEKMVAYYTTVDVLRTKVIQAVSDAATKLRSPRGTPTLFEASGSF